MSGKGTPKRVEPTVAKAATTPRPPAPPIEGIPPTVESVLGVLPGARLLDLCRLFGCEVHDITGGKERLVGKLAQQMTGRLLALLRELGRDELRAVGRRHGLDASARARSDLQGLVLEAAGVDAGELSVRPAPTSADDSGVGKAAGRRSSGCAALVIGCGLLLFFGWIVRAVLGP
jgi:hypothetical protein